MKACLTKHHFTKIARNFGTERPMSIKQMFISKLAFFPWEVILKKKIYQINCINKNWQTPHFCMTLPVCNELFGCREWFSINRKTEIIFCYQWWDCLWISSVALSFNLHWHSILDSWRSELIFWCYKGLCNLHLQYEFDW